MQWLHANTNLEWSGFYIGGINENPADLSWTDGPGTAQALVDMGWKLAPIYVGEQDPSVTGENV